MKRARLVDIRYNKDSPKAKIVTEWTSRKDRIYEVKEIPFSDEDMLLAFVDGAWVSFYKWRFKEVSELDLILFEGGEF